ncbi:Y-family DNA polymerase [Sagittula salina]|uniref:DNA polymerase Y family protein n=1 Tax=Sagittula salina TaxID=2820268 RepID=A0A940MJX1_9RHOB|nr:DNA polymerase Y family protein [Sagittula salina]MBP0483160.1 DNA polymerase Y family protein [Sagittula salina]
MRNRRILSLWFPRLGAERWQRAEPHLREVPFATVATDGNAQTLGAINEIASRHGLFRGQALRDAHALCGELVTRPAYVHREEAFLDALHRWAGKFSPWVASHRPDALVIDLTGCAHLFGGEERICEQVTQDCADLGLSVRTGLADTLGAAWALARFAEADQVPTRNGDAIDQEAPATRSRAGKRRIGPPRGPITGPPENRIAAPGTAWRALSALPVAALRLPAHTEEALIRVGLRRIGDLLDQPRAALTRRFGRHLLDRLDQAIGSAPEPINPAQPPDRFAVRLSFPDPIGLEDDVAEGFSRMLDRLCNTLKSKSKGARVLRMEVYRCDHVMQWQTLTLANALTQPDRILPLLRLKIPEMEAGPGIDMLRLEAVQTEPIQQRTMAGHAEATEQAMRRRDASRNGHRGIEDLIGRLGARLGMEAITRLHPGNSHIPEKTQKTVLAAWTEPASDWVEIDRPRPLLLWRPEPVMAPDRPRLSRQFRWRGREWEALDARGPERIAPEWWLDDPAWRSGPRDYWDVHTTRGDRLWLFYAHGGTLSSGWFCQGLFA